MVKNRSKAKANPPKKVPNKVSSGRKVTRSALAVNTRTQNVLPRITQGGRETQISHREILRDAVVVNPTYTISDTIAVQPALSVYSHGSPIGTWLPKLAAEYDNYMFESLKIHFTTSASSLQKGTILMAYDPNPDSAAPSSFSDLRNMAHAVTGPVRENQVLDLTAAVRGRKLLTRTRAVTAYPLYDCGRIFLGSTLGDSASVGYFEVEYVVRLMNPQTSPSTEAIFTASAPPAVVFTDDGVVVGTGVYVGTSHASRNAFAGTHYLFRKTLLGDTSLLTLNDPTALTTTSGATTIQGVTYSWVSGVPLATFTFPLKGRYRLSGIINAGWQDYATYGASIVKYREGTLVAANDVTVTTTGNQVSIPVVPGSVRGFSNPTLQDDDLRRHLSRGHVHPCFGC